MRSRGFTLIEIIIAVSIIALLILVPFLAFGQIQKQSRDAKRKGDVSMIRESLEQYYADNGAYPDVLGDLVTEGYLAEIPEDPLTGRDVPGTNGTNTFGYEYIPEAGNQTYTLLAPLEEGGEAGAPNKYIVTNPLGLIEINGTPSPTPDGAGGQTIPTYVQPPPSTNTPAASPLPTYNPEAIYFTDWNMDTDAPNKSKIFYATAGFSQIHQFSPEGNFSEKIGMTNRCITNEATPRVVFSSTEDGDADIYIADFNGANRIKLTNNTASDTEPVIAPDGSRIVYLSNKDGTYDLYSIYPDGTDEIRLTDSADQERYVNFVSTGSQSVDDVMIDIIYTDRTSGEEQIYRQRAYGSYAATGSRTDISPIDGESSYGVSVSADGRLIAYHSRADAMSGRAEIFVMTNDGLDHRRMTNYYEHFTFPVIANDKSAVYYYQESPESEFYKVPLGGGSRIQVNDNPSSTSIFEHPPYTFWLDQYLVYRREYDVFMGLNINTGTTTEFIGASAESLVINTCVPQDDSKQQKVLAVEEISMGFGHNCAKNTTGEIYCWGSNSHGQLGRAIRRNVAVQPIEKVVALPSQSIDIFDVSGNHVCVQMADGTPYCWGHSGSGRIGDGTTNDRFWPILVTGAPASGIQDIAAGVLHTCAVTTGGAAYCWGNDSYNQLGNGTGFSSSASPVQVAGLSSGVARVYGSYYHSCAVMANGTAKCWGDNFHGQIGDGTTTNRSEPSDVLGLSDVADISGGYAHTCALRSTGNVSCWGYNASGQLGNGSTTSSYTAVAVQGIPAGSVEKLVSGWSHNCALTSGGAMYCWGENEDGIMGDGTRTDALTAKVVPGFSSGVIDIDTLTYYDNSCAVKSDNTLHCWGEDYTGMEQINLTYEE